MSWSSLSFIHSQSVLYRVAPRCCLTQQINALFPRKAESPPGELVHVCLVHIVHFFRHPPRQLCFSSTSCPYIFLCSPLSQLVPPSPPCLPSTRDARKDKAAPAKRQKSQTPKKRAGAVYSHHLSIQKSASRMLLSTDLRGFRPQPIAHTMGHTPAATT